MVIIVDYGLGNLFSVCKAFEMVGADVKISNLAEDIKQADQIVLPGVGAFGNGMNSLRELGLDTVLTEEVIVNKKPFLGICLGMQLLADTGHELGKHKGLGWVKGEVCPLNASDVGLKVPHIGWNTLNIVCEIPLFSGLPSTNHDVYFVHSFQLVCDSPETVVATVNYGETITAAIQQGNIFATQFHPEKSQENGLKIIENFLDWQPL